jgi:protein-S-isoprenylcysteine O-methyltransferase Ste14
MSDTPWRIRNVPLPEPFLLGIAAGVLLQRLRPCTLPGPRYMHHLVGWPLIAAGINLVVWSLQAAAQLDLERPDRLVTSGPYAVSRNPMYLGWALLHLGAGVAGGSGWVVAALPAVVRLMHREVLREERNLGEEFEEAYGHYRAAAPRYLPVWRSLLGRHSHTAG